MRCFPAVDLPDSLVASVTTIQDRLSDTDGFRFTDPENAHIILEFLGEMSPDRVGAVEDAVESAVEATGVDPFDTSVGGLDVFPSLDYIRVVRVGADGDTAELMRFHEAIECGTTALGFDPESHKFTPHITFTRMDDICGKVLVWRVVGGESPTVGSSRVREVHLKKSDLDPDDPEYETVARVSL